MELGRRLSLKTKLKRLEDELEIYNYILERERDYMNMNPHLVADRAACVLEIANIKKIMKE